MFAGLGGFWLRPAYSFGRLKKAFTTLHSNWVAFWIEYNCEQCFSSLYFVDVEPVCESNVTIFVMIFAYFLEKKTYSARLYFSSILTVIGVFFAQIRTSFDAVGILLCLSSTIFSSLQSSVSALLLESSPGLVLYVTMYNAIVVCFWCIPMVVSFELEYVVFSPIFHELHLLASRLTSFYHFGIHFPVAIAYFTNTLPLIP